MAVVPHDVCTYQEISLCVPNRISLRREFEPLLSLKTGVKFRSTEFARSKGEQHLIQGSGMFMYKFVAVAHHLSWESQEE